ncbi:MAG: Sec-independent protein translocase protein TatB [Syntrophomonas sp.]
MFGFLGNIGPWELVLILMIALIVVGPGKLPDVAKSLGKAVNEFKKSTSGVQKEFQNAIKFEDEPTKNVNTVKAEEKPVSETTETEVIKEEKDN